ncbi:hypothetical protein GQ457_15G011270 [Hibiscus cannabinus]
MDFSLSVPTHNVLHTIKAYAYTTPENEDRPITCGKLSLKMPAVRIAYEKWVLGGDVATVAEPTPAFIE